MSSTPLTPAATAHLAMMIARAERRRAMLEAMAEVGAVFAKEISVRMIDGPYHPEPRHDPGRAFAAVSRSVRLTLALETRIDERLLGLHNGDVLPAEPEAWGTAPVPRGARETRNSAEGWGFGGEAGSHRFDRESLVETECGDFGIAPPSPEVGRADSRRPAASRVGVRRDVGSPGKRYEVDSPGDLAVPPPRSRPEGGSRPPHFGGGRMSGDFRRSGDPPARE